MSTFRVRMDEQLKSDFDKLCESFGMNTSVAITIFVRAVVRERRIPFEITANLETPGVQAFNALRMQAKNKGVQGMTLDDINSVICTTVWHEQNKCLMNAAGGNTMNLNAEF